MEERYIAAPLDTAARKRSIVTLIGLVAFLILIMLIRQVLPIITILALPVILAPALAYASTPIGYILDQDSLTIDRKTLWAVRVPLSQITACHPLPRTSLRRAIRVYGTGGLFGWAGRYRAQDVGAFTMHATNLDRLILIRRGRRRPLVISPEQPSAFLSGLKRQYETIVVPPRPENRRVR